MKDLMLCQPHGSDQVKQREQENPDQVNDVPIQAAKVNWCEVLRAEVSTNTTKEQPSDHGHANDDVGTVKTGHGVVLV